MTTANSSDWLAKISAIIIPLVMLTACSNVVDQQAAIACRDRYRGFEGFNEANWDVSRAESRIARNMDGTEKLHDGAQVYVVVVPPVGEEASFRGFRAADGSYITLFGGDGMTSCTMYKSQSTGRWTNVLGD